MKEYCFGVDIGGTSIKLGLFRSDGELLEKWEIKSRTEQEGQAILPDIAQAVRSCMQRRGIALEQTAGIGLGVPGPIDAAGVVPHTANIGWGYKEVTKELAALTGLSCRGTNDANAAALGELWKGAAAGCRNGVMVTLGTGVGGGIIVDGRILTGVHGAGGEIGHIHAADDIPGVCGCGGHGCLEQVASARGMVRLALRLLEENPDIPTCLCAETLDGRALWNAVKAGDALACEAAERIGQYLGKALSSVAVCVDPEVFVIGGGVSAAGPVLTDYIGKYYRAYVYKGCRGARFVLAALGNDAGIFGAARLMLTEA